MLTAPTGSFYVVWPCERTTGGRSRAQRVQPRCDPWACGDTGGTGLSPSRPHTSMCSPQVLQAPHHSEGSSFVDRDAEQLVAFPECPIAGIAIFRWSRRTASVLPLSSGIPPSAPRTGQVAFTTSGGPTNPVCVILARFHDVPPGDTLCRAPVLGSVGLYLRLLLPARSFWFSSCFYGVLALLGLLRSVDMCHQFWPGLTVALLRFVLVAICLG